MYVLITRVTRDFIFPVKNTFFWPDQVRNVKVFSVQNEKNGITGG